MHIPCDPLSLRLEGLCARGFFTCSLSISAAMALSCREPNRPEEEVAVAEMQQHICSLGRASRKIVFVLQMGEGSYADRWKMFLKPCCKKKKERKRNPAASIFDLALTWHFIPIPGRCPIIEIFVFFSRTLPGGSEAAAGLQLQFTHSKIPLDWRWWDVTPGGNQHRGRHPLQQVCKSLHNAQTRKTLNHKQSLQPWPRRPFLGSEWARSLEHFTWKWYIGIRRNMWPMQSLLYKVLDKLFCIN